MAWFFTDFDINGKSFEITGDDAKHIAKSLRMKVGEEVTVVSPSLQQTESVIKSVTPDTVILSVTNQSKCENEPSTEVTLYQALPKGDKMDFIIQKTVELGIHRIVPVITQRCISRPDEKSLAKKEQRWQKIAKEAAQQSRRGIIPKIEKTCSLSNAVKIIEKETDSKTILFYECGGESVKTLLKSKLEKINIFIGSEGGFAPEEVELIKTAKGSCGTLGKRILRAETAPLAALSIIMYETGNFE